MSLRLRSSTWPNRTRHDDFQILEGEEAVGRLCLIRGPDGLRWRWMIYESQSKAAPPLPIKGGASPKWHSLSRDQAMAAFEAAWRCVQGAIRASMELKQCP
jgi:hypothetical protein